MSDVYNAARFALYITVPSTAPIVESVIFVIGALCAYLEKLARVRNAELMALLNAFLIRMECEKHRGRSATPAWSAQFESLYAGICKYVEDCEDENNSALKQKWCAVRNATHIAEFKRAIDILCEDADKSFF